MSLSDEQQNIYFCFILEADSPSNFHVTQIEGFILRIKDLIEVWLLILNLN